MERKYKEPLSNHTTFKIGGPADVLSIPESEDELIREIKRCQNEGIDYRILGNGSNLLVNDKGINGMVIKNTKACTNLERNENFVEVGSSVSLQKFVKFCVDNSLEGMEYLYSIPATIGGAIYMNAGRGKKHNLSISNNLTSVKIFNGDKITWLDKEECEFGYRRSIFHEREDWVILKAKFELGYQSKKIGEKKIKERMDHVKESQNRKNPSAGSIFLNRSYLAAKLLDGIKIGDAKMRGNWISNLGNASFEDVMWLIRLSKFLTKLRFEDIELEIEIWGS